MTTKIVTRYRAKLRELEDGTTGIFLVRFNEAIVIDKANRRHWSKESQYNSTQPDEVLGELTMSQAVGLLESLINKIGWMAIDHPECKRASADEP